MEWLHFFIALSKGISGSLKPVTKGGGSSPPPEPKYG